MAGTLVVARAMAREIEDGSLRRIAIDDLEMPVPLMIIQRTDKRLSPLQRELREAIEVAAAEPVAAGS